ncbi:MAG: FAD-binding protein [Xanthomonadales bacterium]|jgi:electron transfer flavoprotein alpha subunit|nr:FAD-binding protein [Xanthomonadales bacterium]
MNKILILAEHDGTTLNPGTAKAVSCAAAITGHGGGDIDLIVLGDGIDAVAAQAAAIDGVNAVLATNAPHLAAPLAANHGPELAAAADGYTHVLAPSSTYGKDVLPHAAALKGVNPLSDIMAVDGERRFKRPIYAGNAIVDVTVPEGSLVMGTSRSASWPAAGDGGSASVTTREAACAPAEHTRYVGVETSGGDRPDLQTASVVVSGGRALGSAENFEIVYDLADALGAGVGASRAAVDAGYVPNDMQVGQTGKIIAPDLYLAFGISGAIQHLTGIKDAGTIVAVNKDADAPIFEIADIGLVGDLFTIIPELKAQLS